MKYTITIDTGNAAFGDEDSEHYESLRDNEVARILEETAINLKVGTFYGARRTLPLRDFNGNRVGEINLTED